VTAASLPRSANAPARAVVVGLVLLGAMLRLGVWSRPLEALDGRTLPDDAYLSLYLAKQIGRGAGPLYAGQPTNGFQPLYVFALAPLFAFAEPQDVEQTKFLDRALRAGMALGAACDTAATAVLAALLAARFGWGPAPVIGAALHATQPLFVGTSANGLETSLALLLLLCAWLWRERRCGAGAGAGAWFGLGACLGLAFLARVDAALAVPWIAWPLLRCTRPDGPRWQLVALPQLAAAAAGALICTAPWFAYSWAWTGLLFPESGAAVRFQALAAAGHDPGLRFYAYAVGRALADLWRGAEPLWLCAGAALASGLALAPRGTAPLAPRARAALAAGLLYALCLLAAYLVLVPAYWFFHRYLVPVALLPLLVASALGARSLDARFPGQFVRGSVLTALAVALALPGVLHPRMRELLSAHYDPQLGYRQIGLWAAQHFPAGTVIASWQSGALGYYATRLRVVNLDGVVNGAALRSLRERRQIHYLREIGVEYVLGWPVNETSVLLHSRPGSARRLEYLGDVPGLRSWRQPWRIYRVLPRRASAQDAHP
jgi:hypothetical protein